MNLKEGDYGRYGPFRLMKVKGSELLAGDITNVAKRHFIILRIYPLEHIHTMMGTVDDGTEDSPMAMRFKMNENYLILRYPRPNE